MSINILKKSSNKINKNAWIFKKVNEVIKSENCNEEFYCEENGLVAGVKKVQQCSEFAVCLSGLEGEPKCVCKSEYIGDGFFCVKKTENSPRIYKFCNFLNFFKFLKIH